MLVVSVVLATAALTVSRDSAATLRLLLSPEALLALLGLNLAVFFWRMHCVVDAHRIARRRRALGASPRLDVSSGLVSVKGACASGVP